MSIAEEQEVIKVLALFRQLNHRNKGRVHTWMIATLAAQRAHVSGPSVKIVEAEESGSASVPEILKQHSEVPTRVPLPNEYWIRLRPADYSLCLDRGNKQHCGWKMLESHDKQTWLPLRVYTREELERMAGMEEFQRYRFRIHEIIADWAEPAGSAIQ